MTARIEGACLCGAVTVTAEMARPILRACHCEMCRKQTSAVFMSLATVTGSEKIEGPTKEYNSSAWATRGFCGTCGSTLWYATRQDGARNLAAGLFENAAGASLDLEFFVDMCPQGYAFAGDHRKMTTQETIALFAPEDGELK